MRILPRILTTAALALAATLPTFAQHWQVTNTFHVGGEGSWDYLTVDSQTHRLFVPRSTHTMVLDATGKVLGDIPGQKTAHGVAIVPSANRGFITDGGGEGAIIIFDLKTYAVLGRLTAMPDADGIIYDESIHKVIAVSGDGNKLFTINPDVDPKTGKIDTPIELGGAPEFLATDGAGKAYVNLMDKSLVAQVDLRAGKVTARWPVAPGGSPVGMSIDTKAHRIYIGCRKPQKLVALSTDTGKVLSSVDIGAGVDATKFANGQAFASCRDGSLIVAADHSGTLSTTQTVKTPTGARTMGLDTSTHKIYLPTADFEPAAPGARPKTKPNSFMIIEVSETH